MRVGGLWKKYLWKSIGRFTGRRSVMGRGIELVCKDCGERYSAGEMYVLYGLMECEKCKGKLVKVGR
jgi:hypothetical protein